MLMADCEMKDLSLTYDASIGRRRKPFSLNMSEFEINILRNGAMKNESSMSETLRQALKYWYLNVGIFE